MGYGRTRPLEIVQMELHRHLDALPRLRDAVHRAAPGEAARKAQAEWQDEWARYNEVAEEFRAHVTFERPSS